VKNEVKELVNNELVQGGGLLLTTYNPSKS